jgi:tetratricopeptide (TPR) repeat protein
MNMRRILDVEQETLKLRLLALCATVAGLYFQQRQINILPAVILATTYLVYAVLLRSVILRRVSFPFVIYGMLLIDTATVTAALHLSGSLQSSVFILYPLLIIYYAIYFAYATSIAAATVVSIAFAGYATLRGQETVSGGYMALQVALFLLLAIFSGYLAKREQEEREKKEALQEFIRIESGAKGLMEVAKIINRTLDLYDRWAESYAAREASKEATEKLQFSLSLDAQYALIHFLFGRVYADTGQLPAAIEAFRKAIELDPKLFDAYHMLSETLIRQGAYNQALEPGRRYAEANQMDWVAHQNLAIIYHELGDERKAREEADRAIALSPSEQREALEIYLSRLQAAPLPEGT